MLACCGAGFIFCMYQPDTQAITPARIGMSHRSEILVKLGFSARVMPKKLKSMGLTPSGRRWAILSALWYMASAIGIWI